MSQISRRKFLGMMGAATASTLGKSAWANIGTDKPQPPNFLLILVDDMGWGDISIHGCRTPTPNIDRFFAQSVQLNQFLSCPLCSPTRAGLLTGLDPHRISQGPGVSGLLDTKLMNFGRAFQQNGYRTGIFGKWHNGEAPKFYPAMPHVNDYGFDRWVGCYGGGVDYYTKVWPNRNESPCWYHDKTEVNDERGYATDVLTQHAIDFINGSQGNFFCYLPYNAVHTPLHITEEALRRVPQPLLDAVDGKLRSAHEYYVLINQASFGGNLHQAYLALTGDEDANAIKGNLSRAELNVLYSAMLINLDDNIAKVLAALEQKGVQDNTVVWFLSDNGGRLPWANNLPFKDGKATTWEGGIHTPAAVRWPQQKLIGGRAYSGLMGYLDVFPTCMAMAGVPLPQAVHLDGKNIYPALKNDRPSPVQQYYFIRQRSDVDVLRTPRWKLFRYQDRVELYDMINDPGEQHDVAETHPAIAADLTARIEDYTTRNAIYPGHIAVKDVAMPPAEPTGPILEFNLEVTRPVSGSGSTIQFAMPTVPGEDEIPLYSRTSDRWEYDIRLADDSDTEGFMISPLFGGKAAYESFHSVDQHGQRYDADYSYRKAQGKWIRLSTGCGHMSPYLLSYLPMRVFLTSQKPCRLHFYITNVRVVRKDDTDIPYHFVPDHIGKTLNTPNFKGTIALIPTP